MFFFRVLTLKLTGRVHSYPAAKSVSARSLFICSPVNETNSGACPPTEPIAIARALLRNPKVLLLDEVSLPTLIVNVYLIIALLLTGDVRAGHQVRAGRPGGAGPSGEESDNDRDRA
jgi:hypothetical protein